MRGARSRRSGTEPSARCTTPSPGRARNSQAMDVAPPRRRAPGRRCSPRALLQVRAMTDAFNPTPEHAALRQLVREVAGGGVGRQAAAADRREEFNLPLFRRVGELGLLGITVPERFGGAGMDAVAAVIAHEELSASDPGFCLAYLAHSMLFANNL